MRIAIPLAAGRLAMHFGHCELFALIDVDPANKTIKERQDLTPPVHAPGVLPAWLAEQHVNLVITGGMGMRAQQLFSNAGIDVITGASAETPEKLVSDYLSDSLVCGDNVCDH